MIDYEKLKLAHELAEKYYNQSSYEICIEYNQCYGCNVEYNLILYVKTEPQHFDNLDNLITKLTELTQPKPKYKIDDEVWHVIYAREWVAMQGIVKSVNKNKCHVNGTWWPEQQIYPSRETLIEAQIEYWTKLHHKSLGIPAHGNNAQILVTGNPYIDKIDFDNQCQHQPDYHIKPNYNSYDDGMVSHVEFKCKKCGEFYR